MAVVVTNEAQSLDGLELLKELFASEADQSALVELFRQGDQEGLRNHIRTVAGRSSRHVYSEEVIAGVCLIVVNYGLDQVNVDTAFQLGQCYEYCNNLAEGREWDRWGRYEAGISWLAAQ